jgi:GNAT superfamily N-acetyltransferase
MASGLAMNDGQPRSKSRTAEEIYALYANERRSVAPPGYVMDHPPGLTRLTPTVPNRDGLVMFADLHDSTVEIDQAIEQQKEHFKSLGQSWEWKVHALDRPVDLANRLTAHGLQAGAKEAFMVYNVATPPSVPALPPQVVLERVNSRDGLIAVTRFQEEIWGQAFPWLTGALETAWDRISIFAAWNEQQLVGVGWIEFPPQCSFAELHGGAVHATYRGRGIYSALFETRVAEARQRGIPYLAVDAAPMSRPILLRKGFQFVCDTVPMRCAGHREPEPSSCFQSRTASGMPPDDKMKKTDA